MIAEYLACPRDHRPLEQRNASLVCARGHIYPCVNGVPILLVNEAEPTHGAFETTLRRAREGAEFCDDQENGSSIAVDTYVQQAVAATCGILYVPLIGKLSRYPIPDTRLPRGSGELLLDIGCNWGRWSISAARSGYKVVGIDPCLDAVLAARRITRKLDLDVTYLVADARYLPFKSSSFEMVFSYSVLQHLSKQNVGSCLAEIGRVLGSRGTCLVQMPNKFGIRSLQHQINRGFREDTAFDVRYWSPSELKCAFSQHIGPTNLFVDGYFGLGVQASDLNLLRWRHRCVVYASEMLRKASNRIKLLAYVADSLMSSRENRYKS